jgi:predicted ester cyclase
MIKAYLNAFDDVTINIEDIVTENSKVFYRGTFTGIHKGAFEGILPTLKKISIKVFNEIEIEDGKIIHDWDLVDELGLMQQLDMELVHKEHAH